MIFTLTNLFHGRLTIGVTCFTSDCHRDGFLCTQLRRCAVFSMSEFHRKRLVLWVISSPTSGLPYASCATFSISLFLRTDFPPKATCIMADWDPAAFLYKWPLLLAISSKLDMYYKATCLRNDLHYKQLSWRTTRNSSSLIPTDGLQSEQNTSRAASSHCGRLCTCDCPH